MLKNEKYFAPRGSCCIAGVDEAGRGPLAGPVVSAAVILPEKARLPGLDDSKRLTPAKRIKLLELIGSVAISWAVGVATAEEIDRLNILNATKLAATRALSALNPQPDFIITDALPLPEIKIPQVALIKGDRKCRAVAAASIIAKVFRDRLMLAYHNEYPQYGFAEHKGYLTPKHLDSIRKFGPTTLHRLTFRGVCWFFSHTSLNKSRTFLRLCEQIESTTADSDEINALRREIHLLSSFLPTCEISELLKLLTQKNTKFAL
ncbi:MAG: ribonuclease HII [Candidatus Sumerlaeia bacterium]|nr:ribonuclease HII [Candidatus Sumerlaeia bacterium]